MADLLLLRPRCEGADRSPELRYLASTCRAAAREVFGIVGEIRWSPGGELPALGGGPPPGGPPLLVFGNERIHLGAASLEKMKAAIDGGAGVAVADRMESFALEQEEPVQTLRGFERLERRILDGEIEALERSSSHLPAALFAPSFLAAQEDLTASALLTEPGVLAERGLEDEVVRAGVCYQFIDYYGEVREDILPFLPEGIADVLDVGCGRGLTGRLLQERLGCRVTGIELNPEVAAVAAGHLHRVIVGDVEDLELDERFDAVVATELFEHLSYPEAFLARMKSLLRPGGRIVLSVPNVGHYSIVEDLLAGCWDYVPMGLLCYTHFRFFTRATLVSWIERSGFERYEVVAQTSELPERFAKLGGNLEADLESLATTGFYVVLEA